MEILETPSKTIDAYLAELEPPFQKALSHIRQLMVKAAPEAEEVITYAMPGIGQDGALMAYFAFKKHCSIFPMGNSVFVGMAEEIAPWRTSSGTLQFAPDALPPDELIIRMLEARIAENREKKAARRTRSRKVGDQ
jgi:uncharacterized protein YdhG (YjbR/CyaY superfamily)